MKENTLHKSTNDSDEPTLTKKVQLYSSLDIVSLSIYIEFYRGNICIVFIYFYYLIFGGDCNAYLDKCPNTVYTHKLLFIFLELQYFFGQVSW